MKTEITYPGACHHMPVLPEHLADHVAWATSSTDGQPMHAVATAQIGETPTHQPVCVTTDDLAYAAGQAAMWARIYETLLRDHQDRVALAPLGGAA